MSTPAISEQQNILLETEIDKHNVELRHKKASNHCEGMVDTWEGLKY